jgi:hypothetical protein
VNTEVAAPRDDASRGLPRRLARIALWIGGVALAIAILDLLGVPASDWIGDLFDEVGQVPAWAIGAGVVLESAQTSLAALAWYGILRAASPMRPFPSASSSPPTPPPSRSTASSRPTSAPG